MTAFVATALTLAALWAGGPLGSSRPAAAAGPLDDLPTRVLVAL